MYLCKHKCGNVTGRNPGTSIYFTLLLLPLSPFQPHLISHYFIIVALCSVHLYCVAPILFELELKEKERKTNRKRQFM